MKGKYTNINMSPTHIFVGKIISINTERTLNSVSKQETQICPENIQFDESETEGRFRRTCRIFRIKYNLIHPLLHFK
jgi:hypothetical protein